MKIEIENLSIQFPNFEMKGRSFRKAIFEGIVGGKIIKNETGLFVNAIEDVNLSLKGGDRLGLIGHNGAGKSTLLRAMAGCYHPSQGSITVEGRVNSLLEINIGLDQDSTGFECIKLKSKFLGFNEKELSELIEDVTEFTELGEFLHLPLRVYSSGMKIRLAFALATIGKPEIVIMDEWLGVADQGFQQKAKERLDSFVNKAGIVVLASHSTELISQFCTQVIELKNGHIIRHEKNDHR